LTENEDVLACCICFSSHPSDIWEGKGTQGQNVLLRARPAHKFPLLHSRQELFYFPQVAIWSCQKKNHRHKNHRKIKNAGGLEGMCGHVGGGDREQSHQLAPEATGVWALQGLERKCNSALKTMCAYVYQWKCFISNRIY
jgi:hypothetical protein